MCVIPVYISVCLSVGRSVGRSAESFQFVDDESYGVELDGCSLHSRLSSESLILYISCLFMWISF